MRRVHIDELTKEMRLAKSIYHNDKLILAEGTDNLQRYVDSLINSGIFSVYVVDEISKDIEVPDVVKEVTRKKCKKILNNCFSVIKNQGQLAKELVDDMVTTIIGELLDREDVILSMEDIGAKDDATLIHSVSTAVYAVITGRTLGMTKEELKKLAEGALFHDIGKILLDSELLSKQGKLTDEEYDSIMQHPLIGYDILKKQSQFSEESRLVALQHHERLDGSGYPNGIKGEQITVFSKIVGIADVYDALTAERCYRRSMSNFKAYTMLKKDVGIKYDKDIFKAFMSNIAVYPNGIVVNLSDGTHGIVKNQNRDMPLRPVIRVIDDRNKDDIKLYDLDLKQQSGIDIVE